MPYAIHIKHYLPSVPNTEAEGTFITFEEKFPHARPY